MTTKSHRQNVVKLRTTAETEANKAALKFLKDGHLDKAIVTYTKVLDVPETMTNGSDRADAHYYRAVSKSKAGHPTDEILSDLIIANYQNRSFAKAKIYMGMILFSSGDDERAIRTFQTAISDSLVLREIIETLHEEGALGFGVREDSRTIAETILSNPGLLDMEFELEGF